MFWRRKPKPAPGPEREVEGQVGWMHCGICNEQIPLVVRGIKVCEHEDGTSHLVVDQDWSDAELHMMTAHGMLAGDGAV